jgi:hypothetical protein
MDEEEGEKSIIGWPLRTFHFVLSCYSLIHIHSWMYHVHPKNVSSSRKREIPFETISHPPFHLRTFSVPYSQCHNSESWVSWEDYCVWCYNVACFPALYRFYFIIFIDRILSRSLFFCSSNGKNNSSNSMIKWYFFLCLHLESISNTDFLSFYLTLGNW